VENQNPVINNAVFKILRPFVRILIRYGLSCPEFVDMARQLYVDVANKDYAISGKKQSVSRIATLTGLSRKDVQRIKDGIENGNETTPVPVNRANRVIMGWLRDTEFLTKENKPKIIPLHGNQNSFEALVKRYSGDIPTKAILDELKRIGAVQETNEDKIQLITEGYIPKTEEEKINVMANCVSNQLETINYNLSHPSYAARFQRQIKYVDLSPEVIKEFQEFSKERSIELFTEFNLWLSERKKQLQISDDDKPKGQVGFGLYYFEKDDVGNE